MMFFTACCFALILLGDKCISSENIWSKNLLKNNKTKGDCVGCPNGNLNCDPTWLPKPNLNRALLGIDIAKKHPMPLKPEGDPAFKQIIFNAVYRDETLGNMDVFSFIQPIDNVDCSKEFQSTSWGSMDEYIKGSSSSSMSNWYSGYQGPEISFGVEVPGLVEGSITMPPATSSNKNENSDDADSMQKFFSKEGGSISHTEAICSIYDVTVDINDQSLSLYPSFVDAVKRIDLAVTPREKETVMKKFIEDYGTHYASQSVMGVGISFETRYTEQETLDYDEEKRNECSSHSGGESILGFSDGEASKNCTDSLGDTTKGADTSVKRFISTSYGTLPVGSNSVGEWQDMVHNMWVGGTMAPVPIQQELRLLLDVFGTPAVAKITHEDGTPINITNVFVTAAQGYKEYCTYSECKIPACASDVVIDGKIYQLQEGQINGRNLYKSFDSWLLFFSEEENWKIAQNFESKGILKTSTCPQTGVQFLELEHDLPARPNIQSWEKCSDMCLERPSSCKFWQFEAEQKMCYVIKDYQDILMTSAEVYTGTRDCPGDENIFKNAYGQCVENIMSRSMWIREGNHYFDKEISSQAYEKTSLVVTGGSDGQGYLTSVETVVNSKCKVAQYTESVEGHSLVFTSGDHLLLSCGGYYNPTCLKLDMYGWVDHSEMTQERYYSGSVSLESGVYILGGSHSDQTSDFLPKNQTTWESGPAMPYQFTKGCTVKISEEQFAILGGYFSQNAVSVFDTTTSTWSTKQSLIQGRMSHGCSVINNKIIVAGGSYEGGEVLDSTEIIPLTTWIPETGGKLNTARTSLSIVTVGGFYQRLFAVGGHDYPNDFSTIEEWDEDNEEWKNSPNKLQKGRSSAAAIAVPPSVLCY